MAGVIEFLIKVTDGVTSPLTKIIHNSGKAKTGFDITKASANDLSNRISKLKQHRDLLPPSAEKNIRSINSEIHRLEQSLNRLQTINGSRLKTWAQGAFASLPRFIKNPIVLAGAGIGAAFNEGMKQSREKLDFKFLLGEKGGEAMYDSLRQLQPILGESVQAVAKDLLGVGVAADKVKPMITRLGAVARGDEAKFGALAAAFKDMHREGKLTEGALQAMNEAGFKPLTQISQKTGVSMEVLQQQLAQGKISVKQVEEALADATGKGGQFEGVMERLGREPSVIFARLKQGAWDLAAAFGETVLLPVLTKTAELFEKIVNWGKENETMIYSVIGALLSGAAAYKAYQTYQELAWLWTMRSVVAESLAATAKSVLTVATQGLTAATGALNAVFLASPIGWIVGGMMVIGGAVVWAWNKFETFRKIIFGVWESVKSIFSSVGKFFGKLFGMDMGEYEDVGAAWGRGVARGAENFQSSKKKKSAIEEHFGSPLENALQSTTDGKYEYKGSETEKGINAVSGGGAKHITISIHKLVEKFEVKMTNGTHQMARDIEQLVEEALVRAIGGAVAK